MKRKLAIIILLAVLRAGTAQAGTGWQSLIFTEGHAQEDMETLERFCLLHDITVDDVLWANNCTREDLTPGKRIFLPANHAEMMGIWQKQGAWQPKALVKTTSAALAERAKGTSGMPPKAQAPTAPALSQKAEMPPAPAPKIPEAPKVPEPKTEAPKPRDPVLQSKPAAQKDEKKDEDPLLVLTPEDASGPMRLIVSGDKVAVIRTPATSSPKKPSAAYEAFPPSLLPPLPVKNARRELDYYPTAPGGKMLWPVDGAVSSPFGSRGKRRHDGVDIPMPPGTPIRAAKAGVVALTGTNSTPGFRGYGNFVLLDHGGGIKTLYAHCLSVSVKKGQHIRQGEIVAAVGRTGRATTDHVHFEVRVNNKAVNPIPYLASRTQVARKK